MPSPTSSTRYSLLPTRESVEVEEDNHSETHAVEEREDARLLAPSDDSIQYNMRSEPEPYKLSISPIISLRLLSTSAAIVAFTILVVDATDHAGRHYWYYDNATGRDYIGALVFLGTLLVHNLLAIIQRLLVGSIFSFKVTIEYSGQGWSVGPTKPKKSGRVAMYLDLAVTFGLALSLVITNAVCSHGFNPKRIAATVFAYIAVLLQAFVAFLGFHCKLLVITFESSRKTNVPGVEGRGDIKLPVAVAEIQQTSGRGSPSMHGAGNISPTEGSLV